MLGAVLTAPEPTLENEKIVRQVYREISAKSYLFLQYIAAEKSHILKSFRRFYHSLTRAFPEFELTVSHLVTKGDKVMIRYIISGTQKRDFMGLAPTNTRMAITGIDILRLANGKIVEFWNASQQISVDR